MTFPGVEAPLPAFQVSAQCHFLQEDFPYCSAGSGPSAGLPAAHGLHSSHIGLSISADPCLPLNRVKSEMVSASRLSPQGATAMTYPSHGEHDSCVCGFN